MALIQVSVGYRSYRSVTSAKKTNARLSWGEYKITKNNLGQQLRVVQSFIIKKEELMTEKDFILDENDISFDASGSYNAWFSSFSCPTNLYNILKEKGVHSVLMSFKVTVEDLENNIYEEYYFDLNEPTIIIDEYYEPRISFFESKRIEKETLEEMDDSKDVQIGMQLDYNDGLLQNAMDLQIYYSKDKPVDLELEIYDGMFSIKDKISKNFNRFFLNDFYDQFIETNKISNVNDLFLNGNDWNFLLYFGDTRGIESVTLSSDIFKAFANMHLSGRENGGVCFGGFGQSTDEKPMFECYYPAYFYGGIVQNNFNYSFSEQNTGVKWIDGRPIYRKVIEIGSVSNTSGISEYSTGIDSFIDVLISLKGMGVNGSQMRPIPYGHPTDSNNCGIMLINSSGNTDPSQKIGIRTGQALTNVIIIMEYVKQNDPITRAYFLDNNKNRLLDKNKNMIVLEVKNNG